MNETRNRGEENFAKWKMVVGLPENFPELSPIPDEELEDKTFVGPKTSQIEEIDLTIGVPLAYVVVEKGHGATTFCRYIFRRTQKDSLKRKIIPVEMNLTEFWGSEDFTLDLEEMIKKGIIFHLVSEPWEKALFKPEYFNIIGAFDKKDILRHKAEIWSEIERPKVEWERIKQLCPFFAQRLDRILEHLVKKFGLKVVLFFDIPFDAPVPESASRQQYVEYLGGCIKDLYEIYKIPDGCLSELHFLTRDDFITINSKWDREGIARKVMFDAWAYNEVFAILGSHYFPMRTFSLAEAQNSLAVVLSEKFVELVWDRNSTLHRILSDMKKLMIERLDLEWKDAPYRLEPSEDQIRKWNETRKETTST